jgi:hypothetical protein
MPAHVHAANMALYAQDAAETERPWERWQMSEGDGHWADCDQYISFFTVLEYRRKPRTIRIGEFDVPEPLREVPAMGASYYVPNVFNESSLWTIRNWCNDAVDTLAFYRGLVHSTKEAAQAHAIALIKLAS